VADRSISKNNSENSEHSVLQHLDKQQLIQHVQDLQEELRLSRAFSNIADTGANDAVLQWRGRNRFLAEKIIPVRLKPIASESLNSEKGEHRIIDGDNLAVMTSLLTDFRGGPTRGFDVIYTGRTGDGGIDGRGIARIHGLMSFHVLFQCKRYKGSVGPGEIRDFRGAMVGRADKGMFITTGTFTPAAVKEATRDGAPPIDLLDGNEFADKLKELKLGVRTESVEVVSIEDQWFENV